MATTRASTAARGARRATDVPAAVAELGARYRIAAVRLRRIVARLRAGESKQAIHRDEHLGYQRVDRLARALGWRRDWLSPAVWDHRRTARLDQRQILAAFDRGDTLQTIGDRAGITRERVRQIVRDAGRVPRRAARSKRTTPSHR